MICRVCGGVFHGTSCRVCGKASWQHKYYESNKDKWVSKVKVPCPKILLEQERELRKKQLEACKK